jgi:DNA-binding response OmpR family regulator
MNDENSVTPSESTIDYSGRPFGYLDPDSQTAMICEQDPVTRDKIANELKRLGFEIVQPPTFKESLRYMRFHIFDVIIVNEDFDTGIWEINNVLRFLESLAMIIRRQTFVVLVSAAFATKDNMQAYNKSVDFVINKQELDELEQIIKKALIEHNDFYQVFKDYIHKFGKV